MKKYQAGGVTEQIPQEAQNVLMDRQEEQGRKKFEDMQRQENEAPKKLVKKIYDKMVSKFGRKDTPKTVKKAKGGPVSKRGDGIAKKGRTKGRFV